MCWMTVRHENDALAKGLIATKEAEKTSGGHSWGYAYAKNGNLVIDRELGNMPDNFGDPPVTQNALVHTRLTTRGQRVMTNTHPFTVLDEDREIAGVFAHNGTWYDAPVNTYHSDTWYLRQLMEEYMREKDSFEEAFVEVADETSQTMVALTPDGTGYTYSGRFPIHQSGNIVQSKGLPSRVITGQVMKSTDSGVEIVDRNIGTKYQTSSVANYTRGWKSKS